MTYRLGDLQSAVVRIGFVGENEHTRVIFDCKKVFDEYPSALAALTVQPPEGAAYPAVVVRDGDLVYWDVYDSDLVYDGRGEGQLAFSEKGKAVRSFVFRTAIDRSIVPTGEVPEPLDDFLTRAGEALTAIPQTIQDTFSEISAEAETLPAGSSATAEFNSENMKLSFGIPAGEKGDPGDPGEDGFSPIASVSKSGDTATIRITDKNGTTTAEITDGQDGQPGADGYSPTAIVTKTGSVATITLIDKNGTTSAQISDGTPGDPTQLIDDEAGEGDTDKVWSADKSAEEVSTLNGAINAKQDAPETAGTAGQVLSLDSNLDPVWTTPQSGGGVSDVQVNGTSVVSQGVANVPVAGSSTLGVIKIGNGLILNSSNQIQVDPAGDSQIKAGTASSAFITPYRQEKSVFYGLAKAAGADMKDISSTTVGVYPEAQKSAISEMLNGAETVSGTTPSITAKAGVRYICGEVATLSITAPESGCADVVFESGSTATVLTVTSAKAGVTAIKWADGFDPNNLAVNATYWLKIIDGEYGTATAWGTQSSPTLLDVTLAEATNGVTFVAPKGIHQLTLHMFNSSAIGSGNNSFRFTGAGLDGIGCDITVTFKNGFARLTIFDNFVNIESAAFGTSGQIYTKGLIEKTFTGGQITFSNSSQTGAISAGTRVIVVAQ